MLFLQHILNSTSIPHFVREELGKTPVVHLSETCGRMACFKCRLVLVSEGLR